ncbi:hypothetical protein O6H91_18G007200 [Diphasiastrum complanatum]|uniref:Uncharacterized protein n=2 Tax=Diphasiastrum complanatum TaxID=34168 RepID=A0ACC2AXZ6_DIPCM|nr:hypothetical protein O6H91_18G006900 [Diphasiastrum complanatum]KAJ7522340.1 hypothetical protein O6H91_18G007200 [Diphasiastrum complanatum]
MAFLFPKHTVSLQDLPAGTKYAQEQRLEDLKMQLDIIFRSDIEQKLALRQRKMKFFERRKIERRIRRLERQHRASFDHHSVETIRQAGNIARQLAQLREDLEYVRFFPKTEKYVSLFLGNDDELVVAQRLELRAKIKANLAAARIDLEETGSDDDEAMDLSESDFFMAGSSSDDADADDEWTDKSPRWGDERDDTSREVIPHSPKHDVFNMRQPENQKLDSLEVASSSYHARCHSSTDDGEDQREKSSRVLMPPPPAMHRPSSVLCPIVDPRIRHSSSTSELGTANYLSSSNSDEVARAKSNTSSTISLENIKGSEARDVYGSSQSDAQKLSKRSGRNKKKIKHYV